MSSQQQPQQSSSMFAAASQAIDASMEKIEKMVGLINSMPSMIRTNVIFTSKVVGANIQNLADLVAGAANPKTPPVTKDNYTIITFLQSKHSEVYNALLEYANESKDTPLEKHTVALIALSDKHIKPLVVSS